MELHDGVGKERDCYAFLKISAKLGFKTCCCTDSCPNPAAAAVDTALPGPGLGITCTQLQGCQARDRTQQGQIDAGSNPSLWGDQGLEVKIRV